MSQQSQLRAALAELRQAIAHVEKSLKADAPVTASPDDVSQECRDLRAKLAALQRTLAQLEAKLQRDINAQAPAQTIQDDRDGITQAQREIDALMLQIRYACPPMPPPPPPGQKSKDLLCVASGDNSTTQFPNAVLRFDAKTGGFVDQFVTTEPNFTGTTSVGGYIQDFTFGPDGNVYVVEPYNYRVLKYDGQSGAPLGTFIPSIVPPGKQLNGSAGVGGCQFGPDKNFYICDGRFNSVDRYDGNTGQFLGTFALLDQSLLFGPSDLLFRPDGNLLVASFGKDDRILLVDGQYGTTTGNFASTGAAGVLQDGASLLLDGWDGNLYVSSFGESTQEIQSLPAVLRFDGNTGRFLQVFIPAGSGGLRRPGGMALGYDRKFFVSDIDNDQILAYDGNTGAFLGVFVPPRTSPLRWPRRIWIQTISNGS